MLEKYIEGLRGVIDVSQVWTGEEYEAMIRQVEEEIFADAYAGINAFGANTSKSTGAVNERMDQLHMGKLRNQANGTAEPTGPPSNKDLVAVHNLSADQLIQGIERGGLAMPSLAAAQSVIETLKPLYADALLGAGDNLQANKAAQKNTTGNGDVKYSIRETADGQTVAVVDNDILSNIDLSNWNLQTKNAARAAANEALKKFSDGIVVDGITRKVNRISRKEYTRSNYSEQLANNAPDIYTDKMRAADVLGDIVVATTDWARDTELKHPRTDNFVDFDHGTVLIESGNNQYSAEVVVGITSTGEAVFYDVVDMQLAQFATEKTEPSTTATTNNSPGDIQEGPVTDNVAQNAGKVNEKFSLREPVEYTKDLVAVHNLSADQLIQGIERGGLAMPSLAVTKAEMGHGDFGEISLLFNQNSIDPTVDNQNKLYGADAWTPTQTKLKKNAKFDANKTVSAVNTIKSNIGTEHAADLFNVTAKQFRDTIIQADGSIYDAYAHNIGMQTAYAMESGIISEIPTDQNGKVDQTALQEQLNTVLDTDQGWRGYKQWLNNISDTVITSYDTATNVDILNNMKAQPETAKTFKLTENGELVVPAREYATVDEARQNKNRLSENAAEATKAVASEFLALAQEIGGDTKTVVNAINAAFDSRYSRADIAKTFHQRGVDISTETASQLQALYKKAVELPTPYFEAKPGRVVDFNEVVAAVVPSDIDSDKLSQIQRSGIQVIQYEAGNNQDRVAKVNSVENAKFSVWEPLDEEGMESTDLQALEETDQDSREAGADWPPPLRLPSIEDLDIDTEANAGYDGNTAEDAPFYLPPPADTDILEFDHAEWTQKKADAVQQYGMTAEEYAGVERYVSGRAYEWNAVMRGVPGYERTAFVDFWIDTTLAAFERCPTYTGRTYRNLTFRTKAAFDAYMEEYRHGNVVVTKQFDSASKDPNGYPVKGDHVVHLVIDGVSGRDISDTFGFPDQQEVVYQPGTKLLIAKVATANDGNPLIYAQEVESNGKDVEGTSRNRRSDSAGAVDEGTTQNGRREGYDINGVLRQRRVHRGNDRGSEGSIYESGYLTAQAGTGTGEVNQDIDDQDIPGLRLPTLEDEDNYSLQTDSDGRELREVGDRYSLDEGEERDAQGAVEQQSYRKLDDLMQEYRAALEAGDRAKADAISRKMSQILAQERKANSPKKETAKKTKPVAKSEAILAKKELRNTVTALFSVPDGSLREVGQIIDSTADKLMRSCSAKMPIFGSKWPCSPCEVRPLSFDAAVSTK